MFDDYKRINEIRHKSIIESFQLLAAFNGNITRLLAQPVARGNNSEPWECSIKFILQRFKSEIISLIYLFPPNILVNSINMSMHVKSSISYKY